MHSTNYPQVSIIILNYNSWKDTIECIESVLKSEFNNFKIIVVDNASPNDSVAEITNWMDGRSDFKLQPNTELSKFVLPTEEKPFSYSFTHEKGMLEKNNYKKISLILADKNQGFAAGNNIGIKYALADDQCKYIWLLNNDTVIASTTLESLIQHHQSENKTKKIGILGSKLNYYDTPELLQGVGATFNKYTGKISTVSPNIEETTLELTKVQNIDYAIGASMFVSRDFINDVGVLNETYFLYYEELDWSTRGERKGWKTTYCPFSLIYHKQGATTGTGSKLSSSKKNLSIEKYKYINLIKFYKNHHPSLVFVSYIRLLITLIKKTLKRDFPEVKLIAKIMLSRQHENT